MNAFPDMDINLENIIAEDNLVATRGYWTATHKGQFMGIDATGKKVNVRYIDFWKVENGKCVENWVQMDFLSLMQQLGVLEKEMA
jgi:predicted ester cyclase